MRVRRRRGQRMPWRNIPPDTLGAILQVLGLIVAGLVGTASRIVDQIAKGERKRVWGKELVVDVASFCTMIIVAAGLIEYYDLKGLPAAALAGVLCRAGTPILDNVVNVWIELAKRKG